LKPVVGVNFIQCDVSVVTGRRQRASERLGDWGNCLNWPCRI